MISSQLEVPIIIIIQVAIVSDSAIRIPKRKVNDLINIVTDIPSKDAYSMASYGGNIRYSHRRDEQPSSTSLLRKDDSNSKYDEKSITYGYYNTGSSNFYSKTMNEYNLNRNNTNTLSNMNQTITSVSRPSRNSDSENNRSTMGDQNSRLLSE